MPEVAKCVWYWPLDRLAIAAGATALIAMGLVNLGAWKTRRADFIPGPWGAYCGLEPEYQHGWPYRYVRRDVERLSAQPRAGNTYEPMSPWRPWQGVREIRFGALLLDIGAAATFVVLAAGVVQWSRSRRLRWWQWQLVDLFAVTTLVAIVCAVAVAWRLRRHEEAELIAAFNQRIPDRLAYGNYVGKDAAVPMFLPQHLAHRYVYCFERVVAAQTDRDTDIACKFPRLKLLETRKVAKDFGEHLKEAAELEVLDLHEAALYRHGALDKFTVIRDLPSHSKLRVVQLRLTAVQDADLAWLARCPRLEVVSLALTKVGDDGLRHLTQLTKLRNVVVTSNHVTNEGCRVLSQIDSLEELTIASGTVTDDGVLQLARLKRLKALLLRTAASDEAVAKLRDQLPNCNIDAGGPAKFE